MAGDRLTKDDLDYYRKLRVHCDHCGHPKGSDHAERCPDAPPRYCRICKEPRRKDPRKRHLERCPESRAVKLHQVEEYRKRRAA